MKLKMNCVILFVEDIKKTTDFYENVIGLEIVGEKNDEFNSFEAGGSQFCLHQIPSEYAESNDLGEPREDSYTKIVFYSNDVEKDRRELISKGIKMKEVVRFDSIEMCDGCDCEGNIFQISNR